MKLFGFIFIILLDKMESQELETLKVCSTDDFRVTCDFHSFLAIHKATFTSGREENGTCQLAGSNCSEDILHYIGSKCSGLSQCYVNYTKDHIKKNCTGHGLLIIKYTCVPERSLNKYCNVRLTNTSGYIGSPGYPLFYPRLFNCSWFIEAGDGQQVILTLLDISLRLPGSNNHCEDVVTITEGKNKLLIGCGWSKSLLKTTVSKSNQLEVSLSSKDFIPSKGFLMYYKVKGCTTLPPPKFGYLVYNNGTSALYMCCKDHVFNDTRKDNRHLHCVDDQKWNISVVPCVSSKDLEKADTYLADQSYVKHELSTRTVHVEDVCIPIALMLTLLLGNVIIIYIIYRTRKKRRMKQVKDETQVLESLPTRSTSTA